MKILTLSNCPLVESQGSGYVILNYCRGLRDRGHQVDLFGPESYELWPQLRGRANSYRQALGLVGFVRQQLRRTDYDLVEFYGGEAWLAATLLARMPERRFLLVSHSNGLETYFYDTLIHYAELGLLEHPFGRWYQLDPRRWFRLAFTQVDGIVTVGQGDRQYALSQNYQPAEQVVAIDNPLPSEYLGLPVTWEREPIIGFCGSWIPRKGIRLLVEDMTRILSECPQYRLQLIGVGFEFRAADHFPAAVLPQIEVIPFVERPDLQRLYQRLAVLIVPSLYESFGLITAEAMACGCAVVATPTGFAADLHHGQEAWIIQPESSQLYAGVRQLLQDEPYRRTLAQQGYQRVQRLEWAGAIATLEHTYLTWIQRLQTRRIGAFKQPRSQQGGP